MCVAVKLYYCPTSFSSFKSTYTPGASCDLYEVVDGTGGQEIINVALNGLAEKALQLLARMAGKVVTINHVKFRQFKGVAQLEMMPNSEVRICSRGHDVLRMKKPKFHATSTSVQVKHYARIIVDLRIKKSSELHGPDNYGKFYRSLQLVDLNGSVRDAMVWGSLSKKEDFFTQHIHVRILDATVKRNGQRLDLRDQSQFEFLS